MSFNRITLLPEGFLGPQIRFNYEELSYYFEQNKLGLISDQILLRYLISDVLVASSDSSNKKKYFDCLQTSIELRKDVTLKPIHEEEGCLRNYLAISVSISMFRTITERSNSSFYTYLFP